MVQFKCFTCGSMPLLLSKVTEFGKHQESILIVNLQSSLSDVFCPSRLCPLHSFLYFVSHSFTSPHVSYTPNSPHLVSSHPVLVCLFSLSLSLLPMSFIGGQGPTLLPLHPHLLSVFFSCWCNSAVKCRGHHKLTRSLITVNLMSGKERGGNGSSKKDT